MKFAILGLFFSFLASVPASANMCVKPVIASCKAMTCGCGVCGKCQPGKEREACEAHEAEIKEYDTCIEQQQQTGTKSLDLDKGEKNEDDGDED